MIEDELLPKDPVDRANHEEGVWRVVSVDNVKPLSHSDVKTQGETHGRKVGVLDQVAHNGLQRVEKRSGSGTAGVRQLLEECNSWDPVDSNTVHDLVSCLAGSPERDDTDAESVLGEREGLIADPRVGREALFDQHQHSTSIFLHNAPSDRSVEA